MEQSAFDAYAPAALTCLRAICESGDAKDADRIAAAKLLLEYGVKADPKEENTLRIVLENVPEGYVR
ncbi:MAG: hypothetical protein ABFC62_07775 [Clostridiaceae bacterium]